MGYKDNVTLSSDAPESSGFWLSGIEALAFRIPSGGWEVMALLDAIDLRYFDAPSVDSEQQVVAVGELTRQLGRNWETAVGLNYMYQNQVFDMSATYADEAAIGQVIGHSLSPRWRFRKDWKPWWGELEWGATRQLLEEPLDDYWQTGPRLTLGRALRPGSELSLTYQWLWLTYDNREQADLGGQPISGSSLGLQTHLVEATWSRTWGSKREWQATTRAGWEAVLDNGSGFYDFYQYRLSQDLRYRYKKWEARLRLRVGYYDYLEQPVSSEDPSLRERTLLAISCTGERVLAKHLKVFFNYTWERSFSNLSYDDYAASVLSGGFAATF
jgi:hypothetical protein